VDECHPQRIPLVPCVERKNEATTLRRLTRNDVEKIIEYLSMVLRHFREE
jgi:hypothetical protein